MPLSDVKVTIDLVKPTSRIGLGRPLILAEGMGAPAYKEYESLDALKTSFPEGTTVYKKAAAIFDQGDNRPDKIAVGTFVTGETHESVLKDYFDKDWYFLLLADVEHEDALAISDAVEANAYKMLVVHAKDKNDRAAYKGNDRTIVFYHPNVAEQPDAALVGAVGSKSVGSVTWKFKTLNNVTPQDLPAEEVLATHEDGAICYVTKSGIAQTSEGITASGEYIDVIHGKDWIKVNAEYAIQNALSTNDKIPYTNEGIGLIETELTGVLLAGFENGIIAPDAEGQPLYAVNAKKRDEVEQSDRASRVYNGLSFSFELAGAVHTANVTGEILV